MVMNGFDTNFDGSNEVYAVNTVGFHYVAEPIRVKRDELVRIYLVNVLEFDPLNSFHVHANFFHYYPTGTSLEPTEFTDTVIQGQGQRGILELRFPYAGRLHVPRPRQRVRRARLDRLLRGASLMEARGDRPSAPRLGGAGPGLGRSASLPLLADRGRDRRSSRRSAAPGSASAPARRSRSWRSSARCCARARSS